MSFKFSANSLSKFQGVDPRLVAVIKRALELSPIDFSVVEGLRTLERQKKLKASGASKTLKSKHLFGLAVDLVPYVNGKQDWNTESNFTTIAEAVRKAAIELKVNVYWGRAWDKPLRSYPSAAQGMKEYVERKRSLKQTPFLDGPHFELSFNDK